MFFVVDTRIYPVYRLLPCTGTAFFIYLCTRYIPAVHDIKKVNSTTVQVARVCSYIRTLSIILRNRESYSSPGGWNFLFWERRVAFCTTCVASAERAFPFFPGINLSLCFLFTALFVLIYRFLVLICPVFLFLFVLFSWFVLYVSFSLYSVLLYHMFCTCTMLDFFFSAARPDCKEIYRDMFVA